MLDYLKGILTNLEPNTAVIDIGGVGYKLNISLRTYEKIKTEMNKELKIYSYLILKEDSVELAGFHDILERKAFVLLNRVPGIGSKVAMSILSLMDVATLKSVILSEDTKTLSSVPGVGKKTAQKIIIELKDRIKDLPVDAKKGNFTKVIYEVKQALESLGFSPDEIQSAIKRCTDISADENVEEIIRKVLKKLSK